MSQLTDALDVVDQAIEQAQPARDVTGAADILRDAIERTDTYEAALRRILELAQVPPDFPLHQPPPAAFEIIVDVARTALSGIA